MAHWTPAAEHAAPSLKRPASETLHKPGPTGMSAFAPLLGDKRTSILPHLTASVCSAFPFNPASLIRLAGATFMILGVVLIRT
jgi:hypothetical protein